MILLILSFQAVCGTYECRDGSLKITQLFACVERSIPAGQSVKFVQIGSNDGVLYDTLHPVMAESRQRARQWDGVFVEPLADMMAKLKENKLKIGLRSVGFVSAVINSTCPSNGYSQFFKYIVSEGDPVYMQGVSSLSIPRGRDPRKFARVSVRCLTPIQLAARVERFGALSPHILVIDAEGFDVDILLAISKTWPFGKPLFIVFEVWEAPGKLRPGAVHEMRQMFTSNGYVVRKSEPTGEDYIASLMP
jgi:FkbM family methyltransferase